VIPLADTKGSGRFPFVTVSLIAINIFVFLLELSSSDLDRFIETYALIPALVNFSDFDSLKSFVTSMFLHGDLLHIGSNMLFLWVFGDNVEERLGLFYLPFYLLGGIIAALAQYVVSPSLAIPTLGASGAVSAVLGAYLVLFPTHKVKTLVPVFGFVTFMTLPAMTMLIYWFVVQIVSGLISIGAVAQGGVAWFAHIGGFVFGLLVGSLVRRYYTEGGIRK